MVEKEEFQNVFKEFLDIERADSNCILDVDDINELLRDGSEIIDESPREDIFGYPTRPLYREISNILHIWMVTEHCPLLDLPKYELLDEQEYAQNRLTTISNITPILNNMYSLFSMWSEDEKRYPIKNVIKLLGRRGLLDILGIRKTVGTYDMWPPPRRILEKTFKEKHNPSSGSILTVGARALAKHCHRDETSSWWGQCTGSEAAKNKHAEDIMKNILDNATWLNIHQLPHDVKVIEARQENGYGIRWTCDGKQFRGFLEPQMVCGHAVGWRH